MGKLKKMKNISVLKTLAPSISEQEQRPVGHEPADMVDTTFFGYSK